MYEDMYPQQDTAKDNNFDDSGMNPELNNNLVLEDKIKPNSNFQNNQLNTEEINNNAKTIDDNSLHLDKYIDKLSQNDKFREKEAEYAQKIEDFIVSKTGQSNIKSSWNKITFAFNYLLILSTLCEFLFQRFDVPTLSLCLIIFFIKLGYFSHKHLYKWFFYLLLTVVLDILVFIDISPVSIYYIYLKFLLNRLEILI